MVNIVPTVHIQTIHTVHGRMEHSLTIGHILVMDDMEPAIVLDQPQMR